MVAMVVSEVRRDRRRGERCRSRGRGSPACGRGRRGGTRAGCGSARGACTRPARRRRPACPWRAARRAARSAATARWCRSGGPPCRPRRAGASRASRNSAGVLEVACQPSPSVTTRRKAPGLSPPTQIGGCGFCTGLGAKPMSRKRKNSPSNEGLSSDHSALKTFRISSAWRPRRWNGTPRISSSSFHQPTPDAADEPAVGERVDGGEHLGHDDRVAVTEDEHRGAQPRARRAHGGGGQDDDRLQVRLVGRMRKAPARIAAGRRAREDDVVAHPQRGDAAPIGLAGEGGDRLAGGERPLVREMAADVHRLAMIQR